MDHFFPESKFILTIRDNSEQWYNSITKFHAKLWGKENRVPTKEEFESCVSILMAEIKLIEPKVIVPLGSTALKFLIDPDASITNMRGQWIQKGDYFFLPTFHPAYLLQKKKMKKYSWHDFKLIKKSADRIKELKSSGSL